MTRADLDAVTRCPVDLDAVHGLFLDGPGLGIMAQSMAAMAAELRAAREVVEAAGPVILNPHDLDRLRRLHEAKVAYDQAVIP